MDPASTSPDPSIRTWRIAAGIGFVVAGALEAMFFGLSLLGTMMGGAMSAGAFKEILPDEQGFVGPLVLVIYGLWFAATLLATPIHLVAGVAMLANRAKPRLIWVAIIASLVPVVTFYCAPTSMIAGALGLVAVLKSRPAE